MHFVSNAVKTISAAALAVAAGCSIYDAELLSGDRVAGASAGGPSASSGAGGRHASAGEGGLASGGVGTAPGKAGESGGDAAGPSGGQAGESSQHDGGAAAEAGSGDQAGAGGEVGADGGASAAGMVGAVGGGADAGRGGSNGRGGTSSGGGTSGLPVGGTGGGGRSSGGAESHAGSAGAAGAASEVCSGCARLSVPLTLSSERQHYVIDLPASSDFSTGSISYRVRAMAGTGGEVRAYVQHGGTPDYDLTYGGLRKLDAIGTWTSVTWDLAASAASFDLTRIARIGIEITGANSTAFTNPTLLYLDSITITGPTLGPYEFDSAVTLSSAQTRPAMDVLWLSPEPGESVAGSALSWLGP
jgi:hypothetical protein